MLLHAARVSNWCNIGALELDDLAHPVVVLHGPNRTGKSSLVEAIRCCLLQFDHDSMHGDLQRHIPWTGGMVPEVEVDFEAGGRRWRIVKRFSRGKDGGAVLSEATAPGSYKEVLRGKEAGREVRRILGCDSATDGLNQLLWLTQGTTVLPAEKEFVGNLTLQKRLQEVLGSLLTGRDLDFERNLKTAAGRFFTPTWQDRKGSPVQELTVGLEAARAKLDHLGKRAQSVEHLRLEYDRTLAEARELAQQCAAEEAELARLRAAQQASAERRRVFDAARQAVALAREKAQSARGAYEECLAAERRAEECRAALTDASTKQDLLGGALNDRQVEREVAERRAAEAREALEGVRQRVDDFRDRRRLHELAGQLAAVEQQQAQWHDATNRLSRHDRALGELAAPDKSELQQLRDNRRAAHTLVAQLEAHALRVTLRPIAAAAVEGVVDSAAYGRQELAVGSEHRIAVQRGAVLRLAGWGELEIRRGADEADLDGLARNLDRLNREFADRTRMYGLDPNDNEDLLAILEERGARRRELQSEREVVQRQLQSLAPGGRPTFESQSKKLLAERAAILARRPNLESAALDEAQLTAAEQELDGAQRDTRQQHEIADRELLKVRQAFERTQTQHRAAAENASRAEAMAQAAAQELARCGDRETLRDARDLTARELEQAEERLSGATLTADEQGIGERIHAAEQRCEQREERLRSVQRQADQFRGELRSNLGLHEELAQAEAEVARLTAELAEARLEADAHKVLWETFKNCRTRAVQRTTEVIETRVLEWARRLGLDDYGRMHFAGGFLPDGLVREGVEVPVEFEQESHGTCEQLALLVRLAIGCVLARDETQLAILDDPLTHADRHKHRKMLEILESAALGNQVAGTNGSNGTHTAGRLQILILTCHPERFESLPNVVLRDLAAAIRRR